MKLLEVSPFVLWSLTEIIHSWLWRSNVTVFFPGCIFLIFSFQIARLVLGTDSFLEFCFSYLTMAVVLKFQFQAFGHDTCTHLSFYFILIAFKIPMSSTYF